MYIHVYIYTLLFIVLMQCPGTLNKKLFVGVVALRYQGVALTPTNIIIRPMNYRLNRNGNFSKGA